jgi:hypothetical protein
MKKKEARRVTPKGLSMTDNLHFTIKALALGEFPSQR